MYKPKYELNFSNKYGDNWIQYSIYLGRRVGYVVKDFHTDLYESFLAYMTDEMPMLTSYSRKSVEALLGRAIKIYGVGEKESKRRNKNYWSK